VPTDAEWATLRSNSGYELAGKKLKMNSTLWLTNTGTDDVGFGALPGGYRSYVNGTFYSMGSAAHFWSSTESTTDNAWPRSLSGSSDEIYRNSTYGYAKTSGYSVRCVKDSEE
jgi:uncharacterized protein (TIGR02145 family)